MGNRGCRKSQRSWQEPLLPPSLLLLQNPLGLGTRTGKPLFQLPAGIASPSHCSGKARYAVFSLNLMLWACELATCICYACSHCCRAPSCVDPSCLAGLLQFPHSKFSQRHPGCTVDGVCLWSALQHATC